MNKMYYLCFNLEDETYSDIKAELGDYGIEYLGLYKDTNGDEVSVLKGTQNDLRYWGDSIGYELHPDYLYEEDLDLEDMIPITNSRRVIKNSFEMIYEQIPSEDIDEAIAKYDGSNDYALAEDICKQYKDELSDEDYDNLVDYVQNDIVGAIDNDKIANSKQVKGKMKKQMTNAYKPTDIDSWEKAKDFNKKHGARYCVGWKDSPAYYDHYSKNGKITAYEDDESGDYYMGYKEGDKDEIFFDKDDRVFTPNSKQVKGKMKKQITNAKRMVSRKVTATGKIECSDDGVSVELDTGLGFNVWFDLYVDSYGDVDGDWNQYIFDTTNSDDQMRESYMYYEKDGFPVNFDLCDSEALSEAERQGVIVYNNETRRYEFKGCPNKGETEVVNAKQMKKTNYMLMSMLDKGFADNVDFLENGYDILANKNTINVRLNGRGGALIRNGKKLTEVKSARLDDILAKFILKSAYGHKGSFFKKEEIKNGVMLTDPRGKKFVINSNAKVALEYINMFDQEDCDEALIGLPILNAYSPRTIKNVESIDSDVEMIQLKSALDPSEYAFMPKADMIEDVGQTVVGEHLCSSADKFAIQSFNEKLNGLFANREVKHDNGIVNSLRTHNAMAERTSSAIESAHKQKELKNYFNKKYPEGLSRGALTNALAFEAPSIFNACKINEKLAYNDTFNKMAKRADAVTFRLDNSRDMFIQLDKAGVFSARFRAIPNVEGIRNALAREGYVVSDIESGMTLMLSEDVTPSIIANCANFKVVTEERVMKGSTVETLRGNSVTNALKTYGINDETKVFNELSRVIVG